MNATYRYAIVPALVAFVSPDTLLAAHNGRIVRDGFEWSDVALFAVAVLGVWLARRSMRARAARKRAED